MQASRVASRNTPHVVRADLLQLRLGSLNGGHQEVPHVTGGLVEVKAHPLASEALGDDVEVDAVRVD